MEKSNEYKKGSGSSKKWDGGPGGGPGRGPYGGGGGPRGPRTLADLRSNDHSKPIVFIVYLASFWVFNSKYVIINHEFQVLFLLVDPAVEGKCKSTSFWFICHLFKWTYGFSLFRQYV